MIDRSSYEPMYKQIRRDIEDKILSGQIKIGDKLMSENEMLNHYQVARMTVRAALNELVSSGCVAKERGRGTFCVSMPKKERKKKIDVLLDVDNVYFMPYFVNGISSVLQENDYHLMLHDTNGDMEMMERILRELLEEGTEGILVQPYIGTEALSEGLIAVLQACMDGKIPLVTLDGKFTGFDFAGFMTDDVTGGDLAARHLIDMGHRKIFGVFRNCIKDSTFRCQGYLQAMQRRQLPTTVLDGDGDYEKPLLDAVREGRCTAIVCYNDYLAVECYHLFTRNAIRIPEDVSVVGYDDTELSATAIPKITSVTHPKNIMGEEAARCLMEMIRENQMTYVRKLYQPELAQRDSVASI